MSLLGCGNVVYILLTIQSKSKYIKGPHIILAEPLEHHTYSSLMLLSSTATMATLATSNLTSTTPVPAAPPTLPFSPPLSPRAFSPPPGGLV